MVDQHELNKKIKKRLEDRLDEGMVEEVKKLHEKYGVSWKRLDDFGLEYRYISRHVRGLLSYEEMLDELERAIFRYAKRQMTWFKKDKNTKWVRTYTGAENLISEFIK